MADISNGLQAGAFGLQAAASLGSAFAQSEALRAQGQFQRAMVEINNRFAEERAKDTLQAGNQMAAKIKRKASLTIGAQRAVAAAQGIDVASGSITDQIYDTKTQSEDEILTIKNNAWREAFGIRTQAAVNLNEAKFRERASNSAANQTLMTGGLNALGNIAQGVSFGMKQYGDSNPAQKTGSGVGIATEKVSGDDPYFGSAPRGNYSVSGKDPRWWDEENENSFMGSWARSHIAKQKGGTP